ncbi:MAG: hypothetical protein ACFFER_11195, partial [Candidatus Thorarchaeota archaeon]
CFLASLFQEAKKYGTFPNEFGAYESSPVKFEYLKWQNVLLIRHNSPISEIDRGFRALKGEKEVSSLGCEYDLNDSDCLNHVSQGDCDFFSHFWFSEYKRLEKLGRNTSPLHE